MKRLFITEYGEGRPLAIHCKVKRADVKMYVEKDISVGEGLVELSKNWLDDAKDSDVVVVTSSNLHRYHAVSNKWTPTVGGSKFEYQLNTDPNLWKTLYRLAGKEIDIPDNIAEEFAIGTWHGRNGFRLPAAIGKIDKGLLADGKGINVDGMGICVTADVKGSLFKEFLKPFAQALRRNNFIGFISMLVGFDSKQLYPLSIRAGLDSFLIPPIKEITKATLHWFLLELTKKSFINSNIIPHFGIAVNISIPPYPYTDIKVHQVPINGYCKENANHIWLIDADKKNGMVRCAGNSGALGYVTAGGAGMNLAKSRANRTINVLDIPHLQYRTDIGNGFVNSLRKLDSVYNFM